MRRLALVILLLASPASANPVDSFGFGARAPAMGGAQTAATEDVGANYYNPGALARFDAIRIELGYQHASPHLRINDGDQDVDSSRGLFAGLVAPGNVGGLPIALGVGVFLPDEHVTRTRTFAADRPRWALYDNRPQRIYLASHLAVRVLRGLYVGAGVAYMSRTQGTLDLEGRVGFPDAADSDLAPDLDFDLVTVRYPQAGLLWEATDWLTLGLTYRHQFVVHFEQGFVVRGDVGPPEGAVVEDGHFAMLSRAQDLFQPMQVALGAAVEPNRCWTLALDLTYQRWSAFENPSARIDLDFDLGQFNDLVMVPPRPPLPDPEWRDVVTARAGVEHLAAETRHTRWNLRGGYAYEPSPAPQQKGATNFVDNHRHTVAAGLGVTLRELTVVLPRPFDVDIYAAYTLLPEREHRKTSPVNATGDYVSEGSILQLGVGTRWQF